MLYRLLHKTFLWCIRTGLLHMSHYSWKFAYISSLTVSIPEVCRTERRNHQPKDAVQPGLLQKRWVIDHASCRISQLKLRKFSMRWWLNFHRCRPQKVENFVIRTRTGVKIRSRHNIHLYYHVTEVHSVVFSSLTQKFCETTYCVQRLMWTAVGEREELENICCYRWKERWSYPVEEKEKKGAAGDSKRRGWRQGAEIFNISGKEYQR